MEHQKEIGLSRLNERERFWLTHWQRCRGSGGTIKAYAESNGLSLPAMYFWRRELIARGILDDVEQPVRFRQLRVVPEPELLSLRILFPNGVIVEQARCDPESVEAMLRTVASLL
ncbi:MAG: hypothetical protein HQM01_15845 [Magnetococcales bacterium]|nr:hypothetical protein [Magnetococcales bacterium]